MHWLPPKCDGRIEFREKRLGKSKRACMKDHFRI